MSDKDKKDNLEQRPQIPEGFRVLMAETFGSEEGTRLCEGLDTEPSVSIRVNRAKLERYGGGRDEEARLYPDMTPIEWADGGYRLGTRPRFTSNPLLHAGAFYVQEGASMWLSELVAPYLPERPLRALDLCAAPGGKSVALMEALPEGSLMVSNELMPARAAVLKENIVKWGYPDRLVTSGPAAAFAQLEGVFDIVVVDAPCSGEGMMRKDDTARTQWNPGLVESCARLQREILTDVLPALRPGGLRVYSTCTFNRSEDERNVEWLVEEHGLEIIHPGRRFLPHRDGTEGLFMALLRRPGESEEMPASIPGNQSRGAGKGKGTKGVPALPPELNDWVEKGEREITERDGKFYLVGDMASRIAASLPAKVRVLGYGVEIGERKGRDIIPSHELAVSMVLNKNSFPSVELSEEEALDYLTRTGLRLPDGTPVGIILLTYHGVPLGWAKNMGNRANLLYPKEWRVRTR